MFTLPLHGIWHERQVASGLHALITSDSARNHRHVPVRRSNAAKNGSAMAGAEAPTSYARTAAAAASESRPGEAFSGLFLPAPPTSVLSFPGFSRPPPPPAAPAPQG